MAGAPKQKAHARLLIVTWLALYYLADVTGAAGRQEHSSTGVGLSRGSLSFSLCNADPASGVYSWDFEALRQRYLQPATAALEPLMSLTSQSQVLYYTAAKVNGTWSDQHQAFVIRFEDLPFFLDRSWAPDAGQLGAGADGGGQQLTLNWMVWVPPPAQRPLRVVLPSGDLSPTDSYVIPSWGGVVIYNPAAPIAAEQQEQPGTTVLTSEQLRGVFSIVLAQLRQHLGLPDSFSSCPSPAESATGRSGSSVSNAGGSGTHSSGGSDEGDGNRSSGSVPSGSIARSGIGHEEAAGSCAAAVPFSMDEVDSLLRRALAANVAAAGSTLASLARLVQSMPSLEMPDLVGDQVQKALAARKQALRHAGEGSLQAAVSASQQARETAEAAFFHHSILAQLSFPAQHNLAVYLPFFLPATLPLVVGLLREGKRAVGGKHH